MVKGKTLLRVLCSLRSLREKPMSKPAREVNSTEEEPSNRSGDATPFPIFALHLSLVLNMLMITLRYLRAVLTAFLLLASSAAAQNGGRNADDIPLATGTIAIIDAHIVVRPGVEIARGRIIVRNGLIEAVGPNAAIPYDARVIDADGLTVYAGFIDGFSYAGAPGPLDAKDSIVKPGDPPDSRAGISPMRDVRAHYNRKDNLIDSLRRAGFTLAQTAPRGGMLPGSSALFLLGARDTSRLVLGGPTALVVAFDPADNIYPATPMGIIAKLRNLFHQAEVLKEQDGAFAKDPTGFPRPGFDPVRTALYPVIERKEPILFRASDDLEVRRALSLSQELGFDLILGNVGQARDVAATIRLRKIPLFLSLNFPDKVEEKKDDDDTATRSPEEADAIALPYDSARRPAQTTLDEYRTLQQRTDDYSMVEGERLGLTAVRDEARRAVLIGPARIAAEGTRFGFSTAGTKGEKLRANILEAVKAGLPAEKALAALTTDAAAMLGIEKMAGSVEKGKIANLVVTSGPYFDDTTTVRMTIVDGVVFDYASDEKDEKDDSAKDEKSKKDDLKVLTAVNAADPIAPGRRVAMSRDTSGTILIRNGTVLTITEGTKEETDVLIRNGKIAAIGKDLSAPSGAQVIDATGKYVMPGIIDAHSHIGVTGSVNEWTNPITPEVRIGDVIDPYDVAIYRALAGGVTTSHVLHGSANAIGGESETIKHRYGELDPERIKMEGAPRTIKFALGENPTRVHGRGYGVPPSTRMGMEQVFRQAFTDAQRYMVEWERYDGAKKGDEKNRTAPPKYDERMETMAAILRGEILVHCHSYRADEIVMLMEVLKDFGVENVTFQHVNEGFKVAPELAKFGAMASVFSDWWAYKVEVYYSTAYNAAILTRNGVVTSINSDSPELNRHLYHEAAKSMRYGDLTEEECLRMITINPAIQLGVADRIGSIEVGKDGDIAIFDAHPLSIYTHPLTTIVDGIVRFDAATDPDDMRLRIDPTEKLDVVRVWGEGHDRCMEGVGGEGLGTGD